ncbi:SDR family NAD(P)-dependent oxidoreductase [Bradyrhizobium sp. 164]|uniref:SDR family NAD(P)-dependent oxidoreductase n=1 Tax=Bradyrhizobium sp. 164 TaxID=2782637 RepID=UPI001FF8E773|nr:SDR family NAD(P)-dependent oxidoreductase [Bradyrhizobium sp. 164]MCK1595285.1 SDR family NAD(P)-dependent oxidoreductase [Bradyrhizobium sp. 164]
MLGSKRFEGKTAFITGAASGIGRATAIAFAAEGAGVVITDRWEAALQETAERVKAAGGDVLTITCDVSNPDDVAAAVAKAVNAFGRIDCAFNNAGVENKAAPLHEIELEEWDRVLDINLRGTFICMKHEIAHMLSQGGGVVVNTSSGAGIRGVAGGASYAASKHAIIGMTKSAALLAASFIAGLLQTHRWLAYVGLAVILYVAVEMIWRGTLEIMKVASI